MLFALAELIDATLASLHDPVLLAFRLPQPEAFAWIFIGSLAATAVMVPFLFLHERRLREEIREIVGKPGIQAAA